MFFLFLTLAHKKTLMLLLTLFFAFALAFIPKDVIILERDIFDGNTLTAHSTSVIADEIEFLVNREINKTYGDREKFLDDRWKLTVNMNESPDGTRNQDMWVHSTVFLHGMITRGLHLGVPLDLYSCKMPNVSMIPNCGMVFGYYGLCDITVTSRIESIRLQIYAASRFIKEEIDWFMYHKKLKERPRHVRVTVFEHLATMNEIEAGKEFEEKLLPIFGHLDLEEVLNLYCQFVMEKTFTLALFNVRAEM